LRLKDARTLKNLTQEDMARRINISSRYYLEIEKGRSVPSVVLAIKICYILGTDPREIEEWKGRKD
jgi:putative transcriptional regulator